MKNIKHIANNIIQKQSDESVVRLRKMIEKLKEDRMAISGFANMLAKDAKNASDELKTFLEQTDPDNPNFSPDNVTNIQYGLGRIMGVAEKNTKTYNGLMKVVKDLSNEY